MDCLKSIFSACSMIDPRPKPVSSIYYSEIKSKQKSRSKTNSNISMKCNTEFIENNKDEIVVDML